MSGKSVTLTFGEPEVPPPVLRPSNPAAMTYDERANARVAVKFIVWVVGLPSVLSITFVGAVGLWYAWQFNLKTWAALSAGLIAVTLFAAGLPIAWALVRDHNPFAARTAFVFWLACIAMNGAIMAHFAQHRPAPAAPVSIASPLPSLSPEDAGELDVEIEWRRGTLADYEEGFGPKTPDAEARRAKLQGELRSLEIQRYGAPVTVPTAPSRPSSKPGLDLAALTLLMLGGSALGLLISAGSFAAILTEKAATIRAEAEVAPQPAPLPITGGHPAERADGFEAWASACVSRIQGGRIRPAEAHASYLAFCARNDYALPLAIQEFGRRLRSWLADTYGLNAHHSNGTVYEGVTLPPLSASITAPGMNGAAV